MHAMQLILNTKMLLITFRSPELFGRLDERRVQLICL
jgi:hypothetical protein